MTGLAWGSIIYRDLGAVKPNINALIRYSDNGKGCVFLLGLGTSESGALIYLTEEAS